MTISRNNLIRSRAVQGAKVSTTVNGVTTGDTTIRLKGRRQLAPEELLEFGRSAPAGSRCRPASGEAPSGPLGWRTGLGRFAAAPCPGVRVIKTFFICHLQIHLLLITLHYLCNFMGPTKVIMISTFVSTIPGVTFTPLIFFETFEWAQ